MPVQHEMLGIAFQYPDNWTLEEQNNLPENVMATVSSPTGGFWAVGVYPSATEAADVAQSVVKSMQEEYEGLEAAEHHSTMGGHPVSGFDMDFIYLDMVNEAQVRAFTHGGNTLMIYCQAESRELATVGPVFHAMTASLVRSVFGKSQS